MCVKCVYVVMVSVVVSVVTGIWVEPARRGSLTAWSTVLGSQHAGSDVTFNCSAEGMRDTQTIYWRQQKGLWFTDTYGRGQSPLPYSRTLTLDDANTLLMCDATYSSQPLGQSDEHWQRSQYRVQSAAVPIQVAAAIPTTPSPAVASQRVEVTSDKSLTSLRVGEEVQISCRLTNVVSSFIDIFQVKDGLEMQLAGWRWTIGQEDDGTFIYCRAWRDISFIVSERVLITVVG